MSSPDGRNGTGAGRAVLLAVRFATELALLAVLAVAGASASGGLVVRIVLAVIAPVVATVIWGLVIAPKARRRLADPGRLAVEVALFLAAAAWVALTGKVVLAVVFAVVAIATAGLVRLFTPGS